MKDIVGLSKLLSRIQRRPITLYQNIPNETRQSSVSVIFRPNPQINLGGLEIQSNYPMTQPVPAQDVSAWLDKIQQQNREHSSLIDLLYIKRASNERDTHSGQISFPGGKLDGLENDYEGCIREVKEEVGLDLTDRESFLYLGKIPLNFFAYYRKNLKTMLSVNLFMMLNEKQKLAPSPSEVELAFWTPLDLLLNPSIENIRSLEHPRGPINFVYRHDKAWESPLWKRFFKDFKTMNLPAFKLQNDQILFGLTYAITLHMLIVMTRGEKDINSQLNLMINSFPQVSANFHHDIAGIKGTIAEQIYKQKRLQQFLNPPY